MQYHDSYLGFYSQKWDEHSNHIEQVFGNTEDLIKSDIIWVRSDASRFACLTVANKLVSAVYWDAFNGLTIRRFKNE